MSLPLPSASVPHFEHVRRLDEFLELVRLEYWRALDLFPTQENQTLAFSEEAGELVKAMMDHHQGKGPVEDIKKEGIQAAAMAARVVIGGDSSLSYNGTYYE